MTQIKGQQVHVPRGKATWVKVEVTKMVSSWFRDARDNHGLILHSYDTEGRELVIGRAGQDNNQGLEVSLSLSPDKTGQNSLFFFVQWPLTAALHGGSRGDEESSASPTNDWIELRRILA